MSEPGGGGERNRDDAQNSGPSADTASTSVSADGAKGALVQAKHIPREGRKKSWPLTCDERTAIARAHYEGKGYRVHSGLQFGCELVLYADDPSRVHSDFCVHVTSGPEGRVDWRTVQTLVRSMSDFHKTLILAHVRPKRSSSVVEETKSQSTEGERTSSDGREGEGIEEFEVVELAIATEHAPFRHKTAARRKVKIGSQVKKRKKPSR